MGQARRYRVNAAASGFIMDKKYILFDLDGTLTDSFEGIKNAMIYCLSKYGITPRPKDFRKLIGPPVIWSLEHFYNIEGKQAIEALGYFREYYDTKGCFENRVYEGVEDMLKVLTAHDKKLMIATSKPEPMAIKVIEHFGLADYFCFIAGSMSESEQDSYYADPHVTAPRSTKEDVIRYVLSENDIRDLERTVMIGDRHWDINASHKVGIQSIGVRYGYADEGELEQAEADAIADNPMQIVQHIL